MSKGILYTPPFPPPPPLRQAPSQYGFSARPLAVKVHKAIGDFCNQIPMKLASKIVMIQFGPEGVTDPCYEVVFIGGRMIQFHNVDEFPTDADIARVAIECP